MSDDIKRALRYCACVLGVFIALAFVAEGLWVLYNNGYTVWSSTSWFTLGDLSTQIPTQAVFRPFIFAALAVILWHFRK
jgi:hypothetical protein